MKGIRATGVSREGILSKATPKPEDLPKKHGVCLFGGKEQYRNTLQNRRYTQTAVFYAKRRPTLKPMPFMREAETYPPSLFAACGKNFKTSLADCINKQAAHR